MTKLLTILLACVSFAAVGQIQSDTIQFHRNKFLRNGLYVKPKHMVEIMSINPEASKEMKIAKANYDASQVFGAVGGFLIGWPIGTLVGGGKPNWALAGAGAGVLLISVPFSLKYVRHSKAAIKFYNDGIKGQNTARLRFKVGLAPTGGSLKITF